ncbi:hypothetical protein P7K49_027314 [Saguinus oedipus]|uniref:Uncharacterized protein n=1 Tax=Saguinus oedipus TaxID=9490 RepID=A0ABQ9U9L2_SAGOE|nr:hypothetical protein P7K49_027314 [Saguinus oedipus]
MGSTGGREPFHLRRGAPAPPAGDPRGAAMVPPDAGAPSPGRPGPQAAHGRPSPISVPRGTLREKASSLLLTDRKARRLQTPRRPLPPALAAAAGPGCLRTRAQPPMSTSPKVTPPPPSRTVQPGEGTAGRGLRERECLGAQSAGWESPWRAESPSGGRGAAAWGGAGRERERPSPGRPSAAASLSGPDTGSLPGQRFPRVFRRR